MSAQSVFFALVISALPVSLLAQTANESLASTQTEFRGEAPGLCVIRGAARLISANNATLESSSVNAAAIRISTLVEQNGSGLANAADLTLSVPVICTLTHELSVQSASAGMTRDGGAGAGGVGFRTLLDYQVQTQWAGQTNQSAASALPNLLSVADAASGDLLVSVSIPSGGQPLVAGSYSDTLTILLTPSL